MGSTTKARCRGALRGRESLGVPLNAGGRHSAVVAPFFALQRPAQPMRRRRPVPHGGVGQRTGGVIRNGVPAKPGENDRGPYRQAVAATGLANVKGAEGL